MHKHDNEDIEPICPYAAEFCTNPCFWANSFYGEADRNLVCQCTCRPGCEENCQDDI